MDELSRTAMRGTLTPEIFDGDASVAFPLLSDEQIARVEKIAKRRTFSEGDRLWSVGDRGASFFVVVSGVVNICQPLPGGDKRCIVQHGPRGFTGDIDLLSSKAAVVAAIAAEETTALEVDPIALKKLVVSDSEISDVLLAAFLARRRMLLARQHGEITLVGSRYSPQLYALREFLERNSRPFQWIDIESDAAAAELLERFGLGPGDTPAVLTATDICRNPTVECLAEKMGLADIGPATLYDLAVVGAGPAGLASAVYGGSEGLATIVLDAHAPGGQAATSSKIENYLGFPMGVSGAELSQNALVQAEKFGVRFATPRRVAKLVTEGSVFRLEIEGGASVRARAVVAACGVHYRRLPAENAKCFEGKGIYFAATRMEADLCTNERVAIVGGGNSAGQAAVYLSKRAEHVHVLIRSGSLDHSMSRYLIDRIEALPNVTLHPFTEIRRFDGHGRLERITVGASSKAPDAAQESKREMDVSHVFVFIGAVANTEWLQGCVSMDANGFVHTGDSLTVEEIREAGWPEQTRPSTFETTVPGVFAVGDVRCNSTKRVASAVGEGSVVVQFVHRRVAAASRSAVHA